jgi:CDP-4-dehydro-6-deoxyglucose reductase
MPRRWYEAPVIKIKDLSPNTRSFLIALDNANDFNFQAGQFITLDLPIGDKRNQRWRSYSISNGPDGGRMLELCIVKLDHGLASNYLFEQLNVGDFLKFKGPEGGFVIPGEIDHDMIMVCTGTGIAPFRSMLWDIYQHEIPHQKIHLIFGTRHKEGVLYKGELDFFKAHLDGFNYSVALSRDETDYYYKGYVHQVYMKAYAETREDIKFYLCGWTQMVDEAVTNILTKLNYQPSQVKYELYG